MEHKIATLKFHHGRQHAKCRKEVTKTIEYDANIKLIGFLLRNKRAAPGTLQTLYCGVGSYQLSQSRNIHKENLAVKI